jgi:oligopeptide transport system substrate-binding protein
MKKTYPAEVKNGPMLGLRFYALNNKDPLMKDLRVRKALSMVIDLINRKRCLRKQIL